MKAVIEIGGKQYIVAEKDKILVDKLDSDKDLTLDALALIDGAKTAVGTPTVKDVKVKAKVITPEVKGDKIRAIRYKSKKRVNTIKGHRQQYSEIEITSIK